ncbi:hypothetical protein CK203_082974 [Vitis vinifera]|uniref:Uncharacterized protein n=1 Tax=Vitis vinifera TaxID=29760 RepID=A0A438DEJ9_VITVI|nr:hypothetical protein CK203_082974 [Vitis vinifera]
MPLLLQIYYLQPEIETPLFSPRTREPSDNNPRLASPNLTQEEIPFFISQISTWIFPRFSSKLISKVLDSTTKLFLSLFLRFVAPSSPSSPPLSRSLAHPFSYVIANEAIDSLLKGDEAGVLCKLDLEKAYDHLNWDFLLTVMQKMGFGEKWAGWIRWCISTASFSVLINRSPTGFFQSTQGLSKGTPFPLTSISSLSINLNKSEILLVEELRMLRFWLLNWDAKMRKRLALWKRQFISKGGRITLIRSTLASMPIYLMSLMRMPRVVRLRLEKIQRDFLWGGGGLGIRNFLCKWSWRFATERESFWKLIINRKYGEEGGGGSLVRPFNDWEMETVVSLLSFLQGKRLFVGMEDRVLWNASKNGFSL